MFFYSHRAATAALVEKQSKEMMNLINVKRAEFMQAESLYIDDEYGETEELFPYPTNPPAPTPPGVAKTDIYHDPMVFADIDQIAISVSCSMTRLEAQNNRTKKEYNGVVRSSWKKKYC